MILFALNASILMFTSLLLFAVAENRKTIALLITSLDCSIKIKVTIFKQTQKTMCHAINSTFKCSFFFNSVHWCAHSIFKALVMRMDADRLVVCL
jgi:hypothetical protein